MKVGNRGRSRGGDREDGGDIITCEVPRITNDKDQRRMSGAQ